MIAILVTALLLAAAAAPAAATSPRGAPRTNTIAPWHPVVPFIEDDFGRALALAKERKRPVFIEGWAPW